MVNFGTSGQIPLSAQKIAPSVLRIHRDIDPNIFNQRLQASNQQGTRQADIPPGYHYGLDYNTRNMISNPGYQKALKTSIHRWVSNHIEIQTQRLMNCCLE
jgi:hypothetical protein